MKFLLSIFIFISYCSFSQQNTIEIDLVNQKYGEITVSHKVGKLSSEDKLYIFPSIVPGMYEENNYGKYINDLTIIYKDGTTLEAEKQDVNAFQLENPSEISAIEYTVRHTDYGTSMILGVFNPGGTYFNDSAYYLLNFYGIVGYFINHQSSAYEIHVNKGNRKGVGALPIKTTKNIDIIKAVSYDELADNPFLYRNYSEKDIVSFKIEKMVVEIAVYSENPIINAVYLEENVKKIVTEAANNPLLRNFLPEKYCFLFCFEKRNNLTQGALEHKTSSVYSYATDTTHLLSNLSETISHEFFHILTPLNLHSNLITPYNFYDPKTLSKHLWLYEGITEYISFKNNLSAGLIDTNHFFLMLYSKKRNATYYKNKSMIKCSAKVLSKKGQNFFGNYYDKGALVGFYLDYLITKQSNGKKNISHLLSYLLAKYGKDKPFFEEDLILDITNEYSETNICFSQCVKGKKEVPLNDILADLQVDIHKSEDSIKYTYWSYNFRNMRYSNKEKQFTITKSRLNEEIGMKKILVYEVNGVASENASFYDFFQNSEEDMVLKIMKNNELVEVILKSKFKEGYYHPNKTFLPLSNPEKMSLIDNLLTF